MFKNWNILKRSNFKKSYNKIDWLILLVANIRATKVNLNVSSGSFIDISIDELKITLQRFNTRFKINLNNPTPFESNWKNLGCAIMEPTKQYFSELKPIINQNIIKISTES